jgi:hypothetical protein
MRRNMQRTAIDALLLNAGYELRAAQLETIAMLRKHFGGNAQPVLWAPFIMQGALGKE